MSVAGATGIFDSVQRSSAMAASARRRRMRLLPYVLLAPSLLFLGLFTYLPVVRVVVESLYDKPHGTGAATSFVGLGNYARVLTDPAFHKAALNNLVYAVGVLVPTLVLALAFALAVQRSTRFSAVLRTVFFFPSLVPLVAAASLFFFIFLPGVGLLDYYLARIGLHGPNWLGDSDVALWSIIGLTVWKNAGYYMLFYIAGLQNVPRDTIEAAMIDGANAWQRLRFVILPALAPDHRLRHRDRPDPAPDQRRPRDRADPRRAVQCHQPAALLHLPVGAREFRIRQGRRRDPDQRRGPARHLVRLASDHGTRSAR